MRGYLLSLIGAVATFSGAANAAALGRFDAVPKGHHTLLYVAESLSGWRFVRSREPSGGRDAVSIMHSADPSKSDVKFAGIMIRCASGDPEVVLVVVGAFPLKTKLDVLLGEPGHAERFEGTVTLPGSAIVLSPAATTLVRHLGQTKGELPVRINADTGAISGALSLEGLENAYKLLVTNCPPY